MRTCEKWFIGGFFLLLAGVVSGQALPVIDVYKNPYCGCCGNWIKHLQATGFSVRVHETSDTDATRRQLGMPATYASCHTAKMTIAGKSYLFEGHVPAGDIQRLLREKPAALGLAVPGMPAGSPGMEVPKGQEQPYETLLILPDGSARVYKRHAPGQSQ
ncbi:MAG: DUF411 domain-containing protein [Zoogloeaceae bacterium]|jgi:hypothetical protein|nr:DUF411 domain-containing protein [Zoogloeaceae bacterium]